MILGGGAEQVQSMKVLGVSKYCNSQQKLGFNKKQWNRGEREAFTKDLAGSFVKNFLLVGQTNQPSTVLGGTLNTYFVFCIGHIHLSL